MRFIPHVLLFFVMCDTIWKLDFTHNRLSTIMWWSNEETLLDGSLTLFVFYYTCYTYCIKSNALEYITFPLWTRYKNVRKEFHFFLISTHVELKKQKYAILSLTSFIIISWCTSSLFTGTTFVLLLSLIFFISILYMIIHIINYI